MFLSRLVLPLADAQVQRLLSDPYILHKRLMAAFPPAAGRVLFRVEPSESSDASAVIIVQSEQKPSWGKASLACAASCDEKPFDPTILSGMRLRFRLRANPTARKRPDGRRHGMRQGLLSEEQQLAWLARKGLAGGFDLGGCVVIDEGMVTGRKPSSGGTLKMSFRSVRYEGTLTVTDPARFLSALGAGIGSAKGFGFGLLSIARA